MKKFKLLLILLILPLMTNAQQSTMEEFDTSFAHVVYFWFKNPENKEDRKLFETSLRKFLNDSKFTKTNFIGAPPKAVREVVDDSFTYNLVVTFKSAEAQQNYQNEEAHLIFIEECKHLWEKVIVYDAQGIVE